MIGMVDMPILEEVILEEVVILQEATLEVVDILEEATLEVDIAQAHHMATQVHHTPVGLYTGLIVDMGKWTVLEFQ